LKLKDETEILTQSFLFSDYPDASKRSARQTNSQPTKANCLTPWAFRQILVDRTANGFNRFLNGGLRHTALLRQPADRLPVSHAFFPVRRKAHEIVDVGGHGLAD
jgi:hypothetical protein